jgi:hypothetical protein
VVGVGGGGDAGGGWLVAGGWRLAAGGGWRLAAGGWRLAAGGWRLAAGGWRLAAGGCRFCSFWMPDNYCISPISELCGASLDRRSAMPERQEATITHALPATDCNTQVTITASTAHQATARGRRHQHQESQLLLTALLAAFLPAAGRALRRPSSSRGGRGGALGASGCAAGGWRARRGGAACMRGRMEGEAGNTWEPALQTAWPAAKSAWGCTQACSATGLRRAPSRRARCCPPSAWVTPTAPAWALRLGPPTVMRLGICGGGVQGRQGA